MSSAKSSGPRTSLPALSNPTPPISLTPRGAGGSVGFASAGRGGSSLQSSRRVRFDRRQGVEKPEPRGCAKDLRSAGAFNAPPYPPTLGARGGRSASPPWCKTFFWARGRRKRIARPRSPGKAPLRRFAALPGSLGHAKDKKRRPLSAQKKMGGGAKARSPLGPQNQRRGRQWQYGAVEASGVRLIRIELK